MIYDEAMNANLMIDFLKRLIKDAHCKVFQIADNLQAHHSKVVKARLDQHADETEIYYLPGYSTEKNPYEYLNNDLQLSVHSGLVGRTPKDLRKKTSSFLKRLQRRPEHVSAYFRHPHLAYIA